MDIVLCQRHLLIDRAIHRNMLLLQLALSGLLPERPHKGRGHKARGALHQSRSQLLHLRTGFCVQLLSGLGLHHLRNLIARFTPIQDDIGHVDCREAVFLALFAQQLRQRHAEELAHIAPGDHFLQTLLPRFFRALVEFLVKAVRRQLVEAARFHIEDHRFLAAVCVRLQIAGIMPRRIDGADIGVPRLIARGEQDRHRVVDDCRRCHIRDSLAREGFLQQVVDHLALDARRRKLLGPDDELRIVKVRLLRGEGKRMPQKVRRFMVAVHRLVNEVRQKAEHLIRRGSGAHIIILAFHNQRLADLFHDLIFSRAFQAYPKHAHIRAAKVQRKVLALLLSRRQSHIGLQHTQRARIHVLQPQLQVLPEIRRDLPQPLRINRKLLQNLLELCLIKCHHPTLPFLLFLLTFIF